MADAATDDLPEIVSLTIDGPPMGKARARRGAQGHFYTPNETAQYQSKVGWLTRAAMKGKPRNDVDLLGVRVVFYSDAATGDVDNYVKALLDGCNTIVWRDDVQVVDLHARLHRKAERPRTEFTVYVVEARARNCQNCGKELTFKQVRGGQSYCSARCYDATQRQSTYRSCPGCGGPVYRSPSKSGEEAYCTPECRMRRGACRVCGKPTESRDRAFCGPECSDRWHRERESANPTAMVGTCDICGGKCSRYAKRCRACFIVTKRSA